MEKCYSIRDAAGANAAVKLGANKIANLLELALSPAWLAA